VDFKTEEVQAVQPVHVEGRQPEELPHWASVDQTSINNNKREASCVM